MLYPRHQNPEIFSEVNDWFRKTSTKHKDAVGGGEQESKPSSFVNALHESYIANELTYSYPILTKVGVEAMRAFEKKKDVQSLEKALKKGLPSLLLDYTVSKTMKHLVYDPPEPPKPLIIKKIAVKAPTVGVLT